MAKIRLSSSKIIEDASGTPHLVYDVIESLHPWSEHKLLQGGINGAVLVTDPTRASYRTAFVETFIDNTFIRGEGNTLEEAENKAWHKYQARMNCEQHEWEAGTYKNGAAICRKCGTFERHVFSAEDLNQYCSVCRVPTYYHFEVQDNGETYLFFCEEHYTAPDDLTIENLLGEVVFSPFEKKK